MSRLSRRRPLPRWAAFVVAAACLAAGLYLGSTLDDERQLQRANAAARAGDFAAAISDARSITKAPVAARARATEGFAQLAAGRPADAVRTFAAAVEDAPNDWAVRGGYAQALLAVGRRPEADRQLARAVALNPGLLLPNGFRR